MSSASPGNGNVDIDHNDYKNYSSNGEDNDDDGDIASGEGDALLVDENSH